MTFAKQTLFQKMRIKIHIQNSGQADGTPDKKCVLTKNKENVNE